VALEIHENWLTGRRFFSEDILTDLQSVEIGIYRKKVA
jgi:hypothetical protein